MSDLKEALELLKLSRASVENAAVEVNTMLRHGVLPYGGPDEQNARQVADKGYALLDRIDNLLAKHREVPRVADKVKIEIITIPRGQDTYIRRTTGVKYDYLHQDGKWRSTTFNLGECEGTPQQTGYYPTRVEAEAALAKYGTTPDAV